MTAAYWVWRRELHVMLRGPIVYVIGGLFLVVQGIAFAGLVAAMSDPRRPAPLGALLEGQLSGTLLTWVLQLVVLTLLGMRSIADDTKSGAWELLLTARVSERAAVMGKWLAATTVYALLWIPTLAYLVVVALYRSDGGGWDVPTIIVGYAAAIAMGAALLAWAIAASAAASSTLAAGGLGFAILVGMFLVGELGEVWPAFAIPQLSVRATLSSFARGEVSLSAISTVVAIAVTGLSLAVALACAGRRNARELRTRTVATVGFAVLGIAIVVVTARRPVRWDVAGTNELDPATLGVIAELPAPATITIVDPTLGVLAPVYDEIERVADRMAQAGPITVTRVDPVRVPGGLTQAAREAGILARNLESNGAVVVAVGPHRVVVDRAALATVAVRSDGSPDVTSLAVEQAIAGALAELSSADTTIVCATTGHGELPLLEGRPDNLDWTPVAQRLAADGFQIEQLTLDGEVPDRCRAVIVAGPTTPLPPRDALALQRYVQHGGGLVVAATGRPVAGAQLVATGLEAMLADDGLGLPLAVIVDPTLAVPNVPGGLVIIDGYADHPIDHGFAGARPTIWFQPRAVIAERGARPLVFASTESWGERDLEHAPNKDPDDLAGPVAIAAIGAKHRVVAIGSAESMILPMFAGGASAADLWTERAIRFAAGKSVTTPVIAARRPDQVRLVMTEDQRHTVIAISVAGIPIAWFLLGGGVLVMQRRRRKAAG